MIRALPDTGGSLHRSVRQTGRTEGRGIERD